MNYRLKVNIKKMNKRLILICLLLATTFYNIQAQEKCYTTIRRAKIVTEKPELKSLFDKKEQVLQQILVEKSYQKRSKIVVPVVVHIVYKLEEENISDEQVHSQIQVLNEDFGFTNKNKLSTSHAFYKYCAATGFEFKLANIDPLGNPTSGITRTKTNKDFWKEEEFEDLKFTDSEGINSWDPTSYLNIWVANLDDSSDVLGFAILPDEVSKYAEYDGLVIRHEAFGTVGTAGKNGYGFANLGRTATHEIGHWLNLKHIWGDAVCGNDFVADTEPADSSNSDCPKFPHHPKNSCGSSENGEMFMNYMDYTSDECMNMFTIGQIERMKAALSTYRSKIMTSQGYYTATLVENDLTNYLEVYPNPSTGTINLHITNEVGLNASIALVDLLGNTVKTFGKTTNNMLLNCEELPNGVYFIQLQNAEFNTSLKLILNHE
jgi:hypothetical protein